MYISSIGIVEENIVFFLTKRFVEENQNIVVFREDYILMPQLKC